MSETANQRARAGPRSCFPSTWRGAKWVLLPCGIFFAAACGGASVEGGEVRPLGSEGMRRISALSTAECHAPAAASEAPGGGSKLAAASRQGLEVKRGSQVELWEGGSRAQPAQVLVERIADHQTLQVHRSFPVASGVQYEAVLQPDSGAPLLQRYLLLPRAGIDGVQGSLEVVRDFSTDSAKPTRGGRVVLRCLLVAQQ